MATSVHHRTCHLCEAMCGLTFELEGDEILAVRGDEADVLSRGYLCPKGPAIASLHADPDRLRRPQRRVGERWETIEWEEALDAAADGIFALQNEHGRDALAIYLGNPTVHNLGLTLFGPPFLRALRTKHRYSATSVDQLPQMLVAYLMFGHQLLLPIPDIDRAEHMLIVGANPLVSNGSIMSAPNMRRRLRELQRRGGSFTVVDPRRTETAAIADTHVFIRPGTDALLLIAMLQVILAEGRERPGRLLTMVEGGQRLRSAIERFTPERVAGPTGVDAEQIRAMARTLVERRGVVYGRVGAATQAFGALSHWAINLLNIYIGALDRVGGAMFPRPALDVLDLPRGLGVGPGSFGRWHSRVRGLPEFAGELPAATLAEDIEAGLDAELEGPAEPGPRAAIRGLMTVAGNPALSCPDGRALDRALGRLDFMVALDFYRNETTRHADLILPPCSPLERGHYDVVFNLFAVRNTAKWSPPLFETPGHARQDWQILHGLWSRLAKRRSGDAMLGYPMERATLELLGRLGPEGLLDLGLRAGPHGRRLPRAAAGALGQLRQGSAGVLERLPGKLGDAGSKLGQRLGGQLDLEALRQNPHGVDLGPLEPCLPGRLPKGRERIQLAPEALLDDLGRLERSFPLGAGLPHAPSPERPRFALIGRRSLRSNNSWMHNLPKLVSGKPRCTLLMHPEDAERLALRPGDQVRVRSRVGEVEVPLETSDEIMPGVVSLPHGFGHGRPGAALSVANEHAGANVNELSDAALVDELSGVAAFSGVPVEVALAPPLER
ncbi:molybdopterin-dependent oxidoreductase [Pseudenhygromyxa sp. WMMC2535]|uniref:molybdopterin-dependent oxidoreductase n=1 Tax=Pseudenhygromyxa sp. WMMC2535 TaxID=2712867 RepID=UPI00155181E6|nr:molybdopterin-dependent oxidoreductase [Pseudenhygromyxa sp. WMMC2535]NVB42138.1 molybdopterin-dependent oxidoreductase [Pseudenhygromyxa sp. WMMC2535]